jgi:signal transduction histidine kinase
MVSVGGLAAGMAHEINNPLGGILMGAENILRRVSPTFPKNKESANKFGVDLNKMHDYLIERNIISTIEGIREMGARAAKIVTNMLNFSRKSESRMVPTDLSFLLEKTIEIAAHDYDLKKKYDFRHIDIIREFDNDLPAVPCVATEIEQVVLNLLRNASQAITEKQFTKETPKIILRLKKAGNMARLEIEDNGPGIKEENRKRIFEPFFTTKSLGLGTGLGLSVSYFIITNNHQGTINVETTQGKGSKFIINLPLVRRL